MTKTRFILVMVAVLAIGMGLASAQITGEPMEGLTRNHSNNGGGNVFGCPTSGNSGSPPCANVAGATIQYRFYSPTADSNGNINAAVDGNPIFATAAKGSYVSDVDNSANYFGAGHASTVQMNLVWDGQVRGGTGDHAGYYAAQSQLIATNGETGNTNRSDCSGTRGIQCFSAATGAAAGDPTDTPQGAIGQEGGMRGVPVPTVSDGSTSGQVTLAWLDPTNEYTIDGASGPVTGYNLYVLTDAGVLDSRNVNDAALGSASFVSFHAKGSDGTAVVTCAGLSNPGTYIPVGKVVYQDNDNGANPMLGAFFSANGPTIRCDDLLFTQVTNFNATYMGKVKGQQYVEVMWDTTAEDGTIAFNILRGTSLTGSFSKVGTLPAAGQGGEGSSYSFSDVFKVPGNVREVFYRLQVVEGDGSDQAVGPVRAELSKVTGRQN